MWLHLRNLNADVGQKFRRRLCQCPKLLVVFLFLAAVTCDITVVLKHPQNGSDKWKTFKQRSKFTLIRVAAHRAHNSRERSTTELKSNLLVSALLHHRSRHLYRACSTDNAWTRMLFCSCTMTERSSAWQRSFHTTSQIKSHTALPGPSGAARGNKQYLFSFNVTCRFMYQQVNGTDYCPHQTSEYPHLWLWEAEGREGKPRGHLDFRICKSSLILTRDFSLLQLQASILSHDTIVYNFCKKHIWILELQYGNKISISSNMRYLPFQTPTWAALLLQEDMKLHLGHFPGHPPPVLAELWSNTSSCLHQGQTEFPPVLQPFPAGQLQNRWAFTHRKLTLWDIICWSIATQLFKSDQNKSVWNCPIFFCFYLLLQILTFG